jgi:hypothetical protein
MFRVKYFIAYELVNVEGVMDVGWDIITLPLFGSIEVLVLSYLEETAKIAEIREDEWIVVTKLNKLN